MLEAIAQTLAFAQSQKRRKLIEQGFGWVKTLRSIRQGLRAQQPRAGRRRVGLLARLGTAPQARAVQETGHHTA